MGLITLVYGYIKEIPDHDQNRLLAHNDLAIQCISESECWPPFPRELFHIVDREQESPSITYYGRVITVGGKFKGIEGEWDSWLIKFEELLSNLYWTDAKIHLVTEWLPEIVNTWKVDLEYHNLLRKDSLMPPPDKKYWNFEGQRIIPLE